MSRNTEIWDKNFIKYIIDNPEEFKKYLGSAFNWSTTPQGHTYWGQKLWNNNGTINEDDISFLKSLIGIKDDPFLLDPENKEFC